MTREVGKASLLIVDDEVNFRESLEMALEDLFTVSVTGSLAGAKELLQDSTPDAVLLDIRLPDGDGVRLLPDLACCRPSPVVIMMTAYATVESAVNALKEGAADYFVKPFDIAKLRQELSLHVENRLLKKKVAVLDRELKKIAPPFVTSGSGKMKEIMEKVPQIAPLDLPVLILGETGTGKEKLARWIHDLSGRKGELVAINCAALPKDILESELFGYVRGAFSGAASTKEGLVERARGGTLFLDEIGELPDSAQAKFLRLLEEGVYYKLGETRERQVSFGLISATNNNLVDPGGTFRRDLFYRINGITFQLPPLRERKEDIPLLVGTFIREANYAYKKEVKEVTPQAMRWLVSQSWPGNIRELKWCISRAVAIASGEVLDRGDMDATGGSPAVEPEHSADAGSDEVAIDYQMPFEEATEQLEKQYLQHALRSTETKTEAARMLGISVRVLHYKIKKYNLT